MRGMRRGEGRSWRLSPWGWGLSVAVVVLVILAIVAPSPGVIIGLIAVIAIWAALLASSFPSSQSAWRYPGDSGREDFGAEAAERYEREQGYQD